MAMVVDMASWFFLITGAVFALIGAIGIIRLPDVFSRMHGAGIIDTMGAGMILAGLMLQAGPTIVTVKLGLILAFILFTSPTATHALARATLSGGVKPLLSSGSEKENES
ncbi:MAG: monovalent cation/H(+) antiporter subunit G [Rhodospirillales bacterium]